MKGTVAKMADNKIVHPEGEYTIQQVGAPPRKWDFNGDNGNKVAMITYPIQFEGIADWCDVSQKADAKAPEIGDTLKGHIEDTGKYGYKFVKAKGSGGGWRGGGGQATPGAIWSAAYETSAHVLAGYFAASGTKPASMKEYLAKLDQVAPIIKAMVDKRAGTAEEAKTDTKDDTKTEAPAPAAEKPAAKDPNEKVDLETITDEELGEW